MKNKLIVFMLLAFSGFAHAEGEVAHAEGDYVDITTYIRDPASYSYYAEQLEKDTELIDNTDLTNKLLLEIIKNQEKLINHLINNNSKTPQG